MLQIPLGVPDCSTRLCPPTSTPPNRIAGEIGVFDSEVSLIRNGSSIIIGIIAREVRVFDSELSQAANHNGASSLTLQRSVKRIVGWGGTVTDQTSRDWKVCYERQRRLLLLTQSKLVESKNWRSRTLELRSLSCPDLMHEFEFEVRNPDSTCQNGSYPTFEIFSPERKWSMVGMFLPIQIKDCYFRPRTSW
jgi:hypothetical protein